MLPEKAKRSQGRQRQKQLPPPAQNALNLGSQKPHRGSNSDLKLPGGEDGDNGWETWITGDGPGEGPAQFQKTHPPRPEPQFSVKPERARFDGLVVLVSELIWIDGYDSRPHPRT